MRDHAAEREPSRNPYFSRRWVDDPLRLPDFQHLGREVALQIVEETGRRAIAHWLDKAGQTRGQESSRAFQHADSIRRRLDLDWGELIHERRVA